MTATGAKDFKFTEWLKASGLNDKTKSVLEAQDLADYLPILALTESDLCDLELTVGQRGLLRAAMHSLRTSSTAPVADDSSAPVTLKTLAKDKELNALLKDMGDTHLSDLLASAGGDAGGEVAGASATLLAKTKGEGRPLLIPDFVSQPKGVYEGDSDEYVASVGLGRDLVMRGKKKPTLDQISLAQWLSANVRILLQLISERKITTERVDQYLQYTSEIGDLCQTYTTASVMLLDNAHRLRQHQKQCAWMDIDRHSKDFYLERRPKIGPNKPAYNRGNASSKRQSGQPLDSQGQEICRSFNKTSGCSYTNCKYMHICQVPGCEGNHPKYQHDSTPPRFRGQQSST